MEEHGVERFPVAGKWFRRLMILCIGYIAFFFGSTSTGATPWLLLLLPAIVALAASASAEVYAIARGRGEYIELLSNGIVLTGGVLLWNLRIAYESIASADLKDRWSDRLTRSLLRIVGKPNPPSMELRFRRRVFSWWTIWPLRRLYVRPLNPQAVVAALSARLGAT